MRIHLSLIHTKRQILPIDYRYYLSAWIYKTIYRSDQAFATWLHNKGYDLGRKRFKLFCYSDLLQKGSKLTKDRQGIVFSGRQVDWTISFYVDDAVKHFIKGVFSDQQLEIASMGHKGTFQITGVEILPPPAFEEAMVYRTLSPVMIKKMRMEDGSVDHLGPLDDGYDDLLRTNLLSKYAAFHGAEFSGNSEIKFNLAPGRISTKKHNVYQPDQRPVENKGYHYSFTMTAPVELHKVGYYAGLGNSNSSLGYGMVEYQIKKK